MNGWLVVERQRAPSCEPMEFRGLADARPPATRERKTRRLRRSPKESVFAPRMESEDAVEMVALATDVAAGPLGERIVDAR